PGQTGSPDLHLYRQCRAGDHPGSPRSCDPCRPDWWDNRRCTARGPQALGVSAGSLPDIRIRGAGHDLRPVLPRASGCRWRLVAGPPLDRVHRDGRTYRAAPQLPGGAAGGPTASSPGMTGGSSAGRISIDNRSGYRRRIKTIAAIRRQLTNVPPLVPDAPLAVTLFVLADCQAWLSRGPSV